MKISVLGIKLIVFATLTLCVTCTNGPDDVMQDELNERLLSVLADEYKTKENIQNVETDESKKNKNVVQHQNLKLDLTLPKIHISRDDTYLCKTYKLDDLKTLYITGYQPKHTKNIAHHMLLFGCLKPGYTNQTLWDCEGEMSDASPNNNNDDLKGTSALPKGRVCAEGDNILYAWGNDAPELQLPKNVGFEVGANTNVKYLTLQVHIRTKKKANEIGVKGTGLDVIATTQRLPNVAGIYDFASDIGSISPHSTLNMDIVCRYNSDIPMHPFAFRVHTHKLGVEVMGYRVRNQRWTLLGDISPQLPQAFYSMKNQNIVIKKGDWLAARCVMHNFRDRVTYLGPKHTDEMCNFYIMYSTPKHLLGNKTLVTRDCTHGYPWTHWRNYFLHFPFNYN